PCSRRSSSCPDEAPAGIPASARQSLSAPPGLPSLSDRAPSHHRQTFRTADAARSAASSGRTHSATTDWPTGDGRPRLAAYPSHAPSRGRPPPAPPSQDDTHRNREERVRPPRAPVSTSRPSVRSDPTRSAYPVVAFFRGVSSVFVLFAPGSACIVVLE